jgi:hypothetical protein
MAAYTIYEPPAIRTLIHSSIFPDALGVFKLPGTVYTQWAGVRNNLGMFLLLEPNDKYRLVSVANNIFDATKTPLTTTTRAVIIDILKRAIQTTTAQTLRMPTSWYANIPNLKFQREINLDMLLRAEIYLEELMLEEATERQMRIAVSKIQSAFLDAYVTPTHPICQRRLQREFEILTN